MAAKKSLAFQGSRDSLGKHGEDLAAAFFRARGFEIMERNWSCRFGEIDLICRQGETIHFVEVKTRRSDRFGYPEEAVTAVKLNHLRLAIESYRQRSLCGHLPYQLDVLAVRLSHQYGVEVRYLENIDCSE